MAANSDVDNCGTYKNTIFNIFNDHVPMKKKYICANEAAFMSKESHKVIMKRSRIRNVLLKHRSDTNKNYKTQINLGQKLLRNTKKLY